MTIWRRNMHHFLLGYLLLFLGTLISLVHSETDTKDVNALNEMFKSLNNPSQLSGWTSSGGDPCGDGWKGIKCSGSKVTQINLSNKGLSGDMGYKLSDLTSVTSLDVSKNNLNNQIPYQLPPKAVNINLSQNQFTGSVPYSISQMTEVKDINLSNNQLDGTLNDMFAKLKKLKSLDVSNNQLTNQLPNSFSSLTNLNTLRLQNNQFTGSINVIRDLPIEDLYVTRTYTLLKMMVFNSFFYTVKLMENMRYFTISTHIFSFLFFFDGRNVENNKFSGWIPNELKGIKSLKTGGNSWSTGKAPSPPPGVRHRHPNTSADQDDSGDGVDHKIVTIVASCLGSLLVVAVLVCVFCRRRSSTSPSSHFDDEERNTGHKESALFHSQELVAPPYLSSVKESRGLKTIESGIELDQADLEKSPSIGLKSSVLSHVSTGSEQYASHLKDRRSTSTSVVVYSLEDLKKATGNFAPSHLLGEGNIGGVYRAKCTDGKVLAVKKIDSKHMKGEKPEGFSEIVANISKLHHPNIAELVGYCSEQGNYLLVYDHYRNGSIHEFLHVSDDFSKPLTWNTRISIALGAARAVEYLHDVCSPPIVHKNIKSSNILLDLQLNPHLSDYGMAHFHQRTSQNLGMGYNAPECSSSPYTLKSDVYSFGVVMLELLTGRCPIDNKRPPKEQCLVKWASPQLHDNDALAVMVDPALRGLYPPKSLPPFADIIAQCVKSDPNLRPSTAEVVQSLIQLVQQSNMDMNEDLSTSRRTDDSDYSSVYV